MLGVAEAVLPGLEVPAELRAVLKVLDAAVLVVIADGAGVGRVAIGGQDGAGVLGVGLGRGAGVGSSSSGRQSAVAAVGDGSCQNKIKLYNT